MLFIHFMLWMICRTQAEIDLKQCTRWIEAQIMFFIHIKFVYWFGIYQQLYVVSTSWLFFPRKILTFVDHRRFTLLQRSSVHNVESSFQKCYTIQRIQEAYAVSSYPQLGDRSLKLEIKLAFLSIRGTTSTIIFANELFACLCTQKHKMPISMCLISKRHELS